MIKTHPINRLVINHLQNYETLISYMNSQWWIPNSDWKFKKDYKTKILSLHQLYNLCYQSTQQEELCKEYFIPKSAYFSKWEDFVFSLQ